MRRASFLAVPVLVALIGSIAAAAPDQPEARATAVPVRIVPPGAPEQIPLSVTAPPSAEQVLPGYAYPDDGTIVKIGSADAQVVAQPGTSSSAQANTGALAVSLFGGEITVTSLDLRASVAAGSVSASGNVSASRSPGSRRSGNWSRRPRTSSSPSPTGARSRCSAPRSRRRRSAALGQCVRHRAPRQADRRPRRPCRGQRDRDRIGLDERHGSAAIGRAGEADGADPADAVSAARDPADAPREPGTSIPGGAPPALIRPAPAVTAQLTTGGYVFPVFGPASFGDTFGAPRADVQRRLASR